MNTPAPTPSDAATPRNDEPSYIPEVWTERSVEDTLFLSGGKGIAHAHNYAITRITAEKDKLIAELQATQFEFCEECNFPLSACGEQDPGGTPSMGCKVCQLRAALASRDAEVERLNSLWYAVCGHLRKKDKSLPTPEDVLDRLAKYHAELSSLHADYTAEEREAYGRHIARFEEFIKLRSERDELKESLSITISRAEAAEAYLIKVESERDAALAEVEKLKSMLQDTISRFNDTLSRQSSLVEQVDCLCDERDAALAEVSAIEDATHTMWLDALGKVELLTTYSTGETAEETVGAACARIADRLNDVTEERDELKAGKESMMQLDSSCDEQAVARLLGITLGHVIRPRIRPAVEGLIAERDALAAQVAALRERVLIADVASCTCQTKTPEPQYHAERCPHRVYMELLVIIDTARAALTGEAKP